MYVCAYVHVYEVMHAYVNLCVCVYICIGQCHSLGDMYLFLVFETGSVIDLELTDELRKARDPPTQCKN